MNDDAKEELKDCYDRIAQLEAELAQCQNTLYRQIDLTIQASEDATKASAARIAHLEAALREIKHRKDYQLPSAQGVAAAALDDRT